MDWNKRWITIIQNMSDLSRQSERGITNYALRFEKVRNMHRDMRATSIIVYRIPIQ